jgi:hypothetical protein
VDGGRAEGVAVGGVAAAEEDGFVVGEDGQVVA